VNVTLEQFKAKVKDAFRDIDTEFETMEEDISEQSEKFIHANEVLLTYGKS